MKKPHGCALRKGRVSIPGQIYLVTSITQQRRPIFQNLNAARTLVRVLHDSTHNAHTLCYVIMPDHLHWLVQLGESHTLPRLMQHVKSRSGFYIRQQLQLSDRLWQTGYHDHAVRKDEDIKSLARYVIANPLRTGLVDKIGDYALWDAMWL